MNSFMLPTVEVDGHDTEAIFNAVTGRKGGKPMMVVGRTVKGWWPAAENGHIPGYGEQIVSYASHPYAFAMNGDYLQGIAATFEKRFGVEFEGIRDGA